jgi:hypothetical protein
MKIQVKKNLIIFSKPLEWETISAQLIQLHGPSIMISWKCKRELGFTVRRHKGLVKNSDNFSDDVYDYEIDADLKHRYHYEEQIHLDFYSESALTYFLLKYINAHHA